MAASDSGTNGGEKGTEATEERKRADDNFLGFVWNGKMYGHIRDSMIDRKAYTVRLTHKTWRTNECAQAYIS